MNDLQKRFDVPILFLVFNRPDTTKAVFNVIRKVKPKQLFLAADGPRTNHPADQKNCHAVKAIIKKVDWDCSVKTLYREKNLGCKKAVSSAIDWFFNQVPEGIILEDDCLPSLSFFQFCKENLKKYRNNDEVGMISGNNFQRGHNEIKESYYFSKYTHIWGWASWRRAWRKYDVNMKSWPKVKKSGKLDYIFDTKLEKEYYFSLFNRVYKGKINTWDYQWTYTCWLYQMTTILPRVNMVKNIGFGSDATHTTNSQSSQTLSLENKEIQFPLVHPKIVQRFIPADLYTINHHFRLNFSNVFLHVLLDKLGR